MFVLIDIYIVFRVVVLVFFLHFEKKKINCDYSFCMCLWKWIFNYVICHKLLKIFFTEIDTHIIVILFLWFWCWYACQGFFSNTNMYLLCIKIKNKKINYYVDILENDSSHSIVKKSRIGKRIPVWKKWLSSLISQINSQRVIKSHKKLIRVSHFFFKQVLWSFVLYDNRKISYFIN